MKDVGPVFDATRTIREEARVPFELRGARFPVRKLVTRKLSFVHDHGLDPVVVRGEVYHAIVIAGVAIEPNLGDVRGLQSHSVWPIM